MKRKQRKLPLPPKKHRTVAELFQIAKRGQGIKLTLPEAWDWLKNSREAEAKEKLAQEEQAQREKAEKKARDKKRRAELAANLDNYAATLAGLRDMATMLIQQPEEGSNILGVMRDECQRLNDALSELAMLA